ncbi:MAG TPA: hypothetical protein VIL30_16805 [Ramlibacter sp.]|jgi:hypothetical protein
MDPISIIIVAILAVFTGFGLLIAFAVGSMIFAALPATLGWISEKITKLFYPSA